MSKEIKGPWKHVATGLARSGLPEFEIHWSDAGECVAEIVHGEEAARLIAAAPELLEACIASIEATGGSHLWNGWTRRFLILAENALRAAGIDPATIEVKDTIGPEDSSTGSV